MNTVIDVAVDPIVGVLRRSGLLTKDLDYHVVRASMVIIFSSSAIRNGGRMRRTVSYPSSVTARSSPGSIPSLGTRAPVGSWVSASGPSVP